MKTEVRLAAVEILCQWEQSHGPADAVMDQWLSRHTLGDPRDKHLLMALVYGVIRWRAYLDWILKQVSSHPLSKMRMLTLQTLRIGVFQLLFMDKIPEAAAINESVNCLKSTRQPKWLVGFVNGILRNIVRSKEMIPEPATQNPAIPEDARLSHPKWLLHRWQKRYGKEKAEQICKKNNTPPLLCLRVATGKITLGDFQNLLAVKGIEAVVGEFSPAALKVLGFQGPVSELPGYNEGFFQVQDEAAQLIVPLIAPLSNGRQYLDACAGLGGKTTQLAAILPEGASLVAIEPNKKRAALLEENLSRHVPDSNTLIFKARLEDMQKSFDHQFAGALIDAPCSGLGVIRRHPDIRWNRQPKDINRYQEQQLMLLEVAAPLISPAGVLVYSTCSTEPEENEVVVERFLKKHGEFSLTDCKDVLPFQAATLVDNHGFYRTLPGEHDLDGFFAARLIKK